MSIKHVSLCVIRIYSWNKDVQPYESTFKATWNEHKLFHLLNVQQSNPNILLRKNQMHDFNHMSPRSSNPLPPPPLSALRIILSELCLAIKPQQLDLRYITHSAMEEPVMVAVCWYRHISEAQVSQNNVACLRGDLVSGVIQDILVLCTVT